MFRMTKVSKNRNYEHDDIHYYHEPLIQSQTKMFEHFLNHFKNGKRTYNSTDGILDIPKTNLYDSYFGEPNGYENVKKVQRGAKKIRRGVKKFLNSKIVRHCCVGAFANFEHTVYRPVKNGKYGKYHTNYVKYHPHVHITFINKKHHNFSINQKSLKYNDLYRTQDKLSPKESVNLSKGDCIELNKEWNRDIHSKYNHFYLKPTYIKSQDPMQHVKAYWSAGWGDYAKDLKPFTYAKPVSKSIDSNTSLDIVHQVSHDLANESNKYRGQEANFIRQVQNHDYYDAKQITDKHHGNIAHGMLATEVGWYNHKNAFPRHMYTGALHDYAKKHIFPKFPQEARADNLNYLSDIKTQPYQHNSVNNKHSFNQSLNSNIKQMLAKRNTKPYFKDGHHSYSKHKSLSISNMHHKKNPSVNSAKLEHFNEWMNGPSID